ncbi:unnamed protein product [Rotaria socialis]|uniref:Uncharacterized protein n=3 Tax=Rotaria socialis TaxID=392032 RepID=A0A818CZS9_9BILA|nr:unnamed protein product [Rotaria socialis]
MIFNMHCRLSCPTNDSTCSSFLFNHPDYTSTINHHTCSPLPNHDQIPPPTVPRRRQRLEDLIITYSSNYYATYPCQASPLSSDSSESPSLWSPRRIHQQPEDNGVYCDLFNLLERPLPSPSPAKQRKKYMLNDHHSRLRHPSVAYKSAHTKMKDIHERKRHHYQEQQSSYDKQKKHEDDELSVILQYDRLKENAKNNNCVYQQHSRSKRFFRRVARNYFCMPMTVANGEFSN